MITNAYLLVCLGAALLRAGRIAAAGLCRFGAIALMAMKQSRARQAARMLERHRHLLDGTSISFERLRDARAAASRNDDALGVAQPIPLHGVRRSAARRIGNRSLRSAQ